MPVTMPFDEAIEESDALSGGRSLLIGNGFSIAWNPAIFAYSTLFDEAALTRLSQGKEEIFDALSTRDFEVVIDGLRTAANLAEIYDDAHPELADNLRWDATVVQNGLAEVLAARHPATQFDVSTEEKESARAFLSNFGRMFSLNYDLLLYWVVNAYRGSAHAVHRADGFEWPTFEDRRYLMFKRAAAERGARVFYLHGGLHLFVEDARLTKLNYGGGPLVDQLQLRLEDGDYPLVVTEGRTEEKQAKIQKSTYLSYASEQLGKLSGVLFLYGLALSPNDAHIFALLESADSGIHTLYVGLHDPASPESRAAARRAHDIADARAANKGRPLDVKFFDSATAHVWR